MAPIALLSEKNFQISSENLQELEHLSSLLHLFHHRNKNQHRRSHWYRHFSSFRRQLSSLLSDLNFLNAVPTTNLARTKKQKVQDPQIVTRTQERLKFWRDVMFTKWQHAFGQLVADGRFSVLGLVLIAILAQVGNLVGVVKELEELGECEVRKVLSEFAETEKEWDEGTPLARSVEDQGEVVDRRYEDESGQQIAVAVTAAAADGNAGAEIVMPAEDEMTLTRAKTGTKRAAGLEPAIIKPKKKKRKKAGGNAIDDIFG